MSGRNPWPPPNRTFTSASFIPDTPVTPASDLQPVGQDALMRKITVSASPDLRSIALGVVREVLSEENTDVLIALALSKVKLPFYLRWVPLGKVLDRLLPEKLLEVFEEILG